MHDIIQFVLQAGFVAKVVLIVLFFLSIISWAIIFEKLRLLWKIKRESHKFRRLFIIRAKWADMYSHSREYKYSPHAHVFRKCFSTLQAWNRPSDGTGTEFTGANSNLPVVTQNPMGLVPVINAAIAEEMSLLEKHLIFLATTVSISPFLGLLGTVWGIMTAFLNMGLKGSADISAVGPGIAEALITTVAGLAVAIPAVVAYNYFVDKLRRLENELQNFFTNLTTKLAREKMH